MQLSSSSLTNVDVSSIVSSNKLHKTIENIVYNDDIHTVQITESSKVDGNLKPSYESEICMKSDCPSQETSQARGLVISNTISVCDLPINNTLTHCEENKNSRINLPVNNTLTHCQQGKNSRAESPIIAYHYILDDDLEQLDTTSKLEFNRPEHEIGLKSETNNADTGIKISDQELGMPNKGNTDCGYQEDEIDLKSSKNQDLESECSEIDKPEGQRNESSDAKQDTVTGDGMVKKPRGRPKGSIRKQKIDPCLSSSVDAYASGRRSRRVHTKYERIVQKSREQQESLKEQEELKLQEKSVVVPIDQSDTVQTLQFQDEDIDQESENPSLVEPTTFLNQIMIMDARSIAEQQFVGENYSNGEIETNQNSVTLMEERNISSDFHNVAGNLVANEQEIEPGHEKKRKVVINSKRLPAVDRLNKKDLKSVVEMEKYIVKQQKKADSSSNSDAPVVIENVFGDVIYVVPEENLYDVSQESESTDNVEMNGMSNITDQHQMFDRFNSSVTYPTAIVQNAYASLDECQGKQIFSLSAGGKQAIDNFTSSQQRFGLATSGQQIFSPVTSGQQIFRPVISDEQIFSPVISDHQTFSPIITSDHQLFSIATSENQIQDSNSFMESEFFHSLGLGPTNNITNRPQHQGQQKLYKRKGVDLQNTSDSPLKKQKYSAMKKSNLHILSRWKKKKKGKSLVKERKEKHIVPLKPGKQKKYNKQKKLKNITLKTKLTKREPMKQGPKKRPGRPKKTVDKNLIKFKKKRGRPKKDISSEEKTGQFMNEHVLGHKKRLNGKSTDFKQVNNIKKKLKCMKKGKEPKFSGKLSQLVAKSVSKAKMVATKKFKGKVLATEIPQKRGRGRPKIVKANNEENKSYTVSTISDGEILSSSSSEDSKLVLVNNSDQFTEKNKKFVQIKKKRGRPKKVSPPQHISDISSNDYSMQNLDHDAKQVSLIEKGKFIDFWESKRAKRQYSKFPFKMRGKHKIVTLMNLEIPLKRISTKDVKPEIQIAEKKRRGRPKTKHNTKIPKTQRQKLIKSETLELGENMSFSSVQLSEKEVTTAIGDVQNAIRNSIGQNVTEILIAQDRKHINETKVKKTGKSQNVSVFDDGNNVIDINDIQNESEIRKAKNIVYKSQKTTETNKTENSIKTSDNTTVNSDETANTSSEKGHLDINVVPSNVSKETRVQKNLDISISLVSRELIVKPMKEKRPVTVCYKRHNTIISSEKRLGKKQVSKNLKEKKDSPTNEIVDNFNQQNTTNSLKKPDSEDTCLEKVLEIRSESSIDIMGKKAMSHDNKEQTSQSQKIRVVSNEVNLIDAKDGSASSLSPVTSTNSQKANKYLPCVPVLKRGLNSPSKKKIGRPRKQVFDNVKNDTIILDTENIALQGKVLKNCLKKKRGRPPKSLQKHGEMKSLSRSKMTANKTQMNSHLMMKKRRGRPKKYVCDKKITVQSKRNNLEHELHINDTVDDENQEVPSFVEKGHEIKMEASKRSKILNERNKSPKKIWMEMGGKCFKLVHTDSGPGSNPTNTGSMSSNANLNSLKASEVITGQGTSNRNTLDKCQQKQYMISENDVIVDKQLDNSREINMLSSSQFMEESFESGGCDQINYDTDLELLERGINFNSSTNNEQVNRGSDSIEDTSRGHCEEETGTINFSSCSVGRLNNEQAMMDNNDITENSIGDKNLENKDTRFTTNVKQNYNFQGNKSEFEKEENILTEGSSDVEMGILEKIAIFKECAKKRGRPRKMPVLTMENVENMFDKIKKGRVKNSTSTCTCQSHDLECMTANNQNNEVFMDFEFKSSFCTGAPMKKVKIGRKTSYSNQDLVSNAQNHEGLEIMIKQHPAVKKMAVKTNSENTLKRKAGRPKKYAIVDFKESQLNDQLTNKKKKVGRPKKINKSEETADNCENILVLSKKEHKIGKSKKYSNLNRNINNIAKDLKKKYGKVGRPGKTQSENKIKDDIETIGRKKRGRPQKKKIIDLHDVNFETVQSIDEHRMQSMDKTVNEQSENEGNNSKANNINMIGGPMKSVEQIVENIDINDMCVERNSCMKKKMKVGRPKKYTTEGPVLDIDHQPVTIDEAIGGPQTVENKVKTGHSRPKKNLEEDGQGKLEKTSIKGKTNDDEIQIFPRKTGCGRAKKKLIEEKSNNFGLENAIKSRKIGRGRPRKDFSQKKLKVMCSNLEEQLNETGESIIPENILVNENLGVFTMEKTVLDQTTTCKENIKGKKLINTFIEKKTNSGNVSPVKAGQISKEKDKSESLNKCKTVGKLENNVEKIVMKKVKPRKSSKTLYEDVLNKIKEHISESPVKTMKRGRPRKMVKTPTNFEKEMPKLDIEVQVSQTGGEKSASMKELQVTSKTSFQTTPFNGSVNSKEESHDRNKDKSTNVKTELFPSNVEKQNNLHSIGNIETISGIKKTTGNVYVDTQTFLKLKKMAGAKHEICKQAMKSGSLKTLKHGQQKSTSISCSESNKSSSSFDELNKEEGPEMILTDLHEENDSINNNSDFVPLKQNSSQYQKDL